MNQVNLPSSSSKASDRVRKPFCRALTCILQASVDLTSVVLLLICAFFVTFTDRYWTACMDSKSATPFDWCCRVCTVTEVLKACANHRTATRWNVMAPSECPAGYAAPCHHMPCLYAREPAGTNHCYNWKRCRCAVCTHAPGCAKCRTDQLSTSAERKPSGCYSAVGKYSFTSILPPFTYLLCREEEAEQAS